MQVQEIALSTLTLPSLHLVQCTLAFATFFFAGRLLFLGPKSFRVSELKRSLALMFRKPLEGASKASNLETFVLFLQCCLGFFSLCVLFAWDMHSNAFSIAKSLVFFSGFLPLLLLSRRNSPVMDTKFIQNIIGRQCFFVVLSAGLMVGPHRINFESHAWSLLSVFLFLFLALGAYLKQSHLPRHAAVPEGLAMEDALPPMTRFFVQVAKALDLSLAVLIIGIIILEGTTWQRVELSAFASQLCLGLACLALGVAMSHLMRPLAPKKAPQFMLLICLPVVALLKAYMLFA